MRSKKEQSCCMDKFSGSYGTSLSMFSDILKKIIQSPFLQSGLESEEGGRPQGTSDDLQTLFLVIPNQPRSRILTDCNPPLRLRPTPQAAVVLPQLFPFFITIFSAFHFSGQREAQGAHLFLSCSFACSQRQSSHMHACTHTPLQTPQAPFRTMNGNQK